MPTSENTSACVASCLPTETLQAIFEDVLESEGSAGPFRIPVLKLTHVCTAWRLSAHSYPRLWQRLSIPVDLPGTGTSAIADLFIRLSGALPMDWYFGINKRLDDQTTRPSELLNYPFDWSCLQINAHRCQRLFFGFGTASTVCPMLIPAGTRQTFTNLNWILLEFWGIEPTYDITKIGKIDAPNLCTLAAQDCGLALHLLTSTSLSYVDDLEVQPWDRNAPSLIRACRHNLYELRLDWDTGVPESHVLPNLAGEDVIELLELESLAIDPASNINIHALISLLYAPQLETILLQSYCDWTECGQQLALSLVGAAERFPGVTSLVIGEVCPVEIEMVLQQLPHVTELLLDCMDEPNALNILVNFLTPTFGPKVSRVVFARNKFDRSKTNLGFSEIMATRKELALANEFEVEEVELVFDEE